MDTDFEHDLYISEKLIMSVFKCVCSAGGTCDLLTFVEVCSPTYLGLMLINVRHGFQIHFLDSLQVTEKVYIVRISKIYKSLPLLFILK